MSLQDILKKIIDDAKAEAAVILKESEKEKRSVIASFTEKEKIELAKLKTKADGARKVIESKTQSMARRQNAKTLLAAKQQVINETLLLFLQHLESANDDLYTKLLEKLFSEIPSHSGKIFVPRARKDITKKLAPDGMEILIEDKIKGGFVYRHGKQEIDNSFHNLIFFEYKAELSTYFSEQLKLI